MNLVMERVAGSCNDTVKEKETPLFVMRSKVWKSYRIMFEETTDESDRMRRQWIWIWCESKGRRIFIISSYKLYSQIDWRWEKSSWSRLQYSIASVMIPLVNKSLRNTWKGKRSNITDGNKEGRENIFKKSTGQVHFKEKRVKAESS